jgi:hypothetical protein
MTTAVNPSSTLTGLADPNLRADPATTTRGQRLWGLYFRFALLYVLAWTVQWLDVYFRWPVPFEETRPTGLFQTIHLGMANGLGLDPLYAGHMGLLFTILLAAIGAIAWWTIEHDGPAEVVIGELSGVATRYVLAASMFVWGVAMIPPLYLPQPGPVDWMTLFGELSQRQAMEFGVGHGPLYQSFTGAQTALAGLLLLWRRTTLLGALLTIVAMGHMAMLISAFLLRGTHLELGFAGPAGHMLLMAGLLVFTDWKRTVNYFFLNGDAIRPRLLPAERLPILSSIAARRLKVFAITVIALPPVIRSHDMMEDMKTKSALYGVWYVDSVSRNGQSLPMTYEARRWRLLAIGNYGERMTIRQTDGTRLDFLMGLPVDSSDATWRQDHIKPTNGDTGTLVLRRLPHRHARAPNSSQEMLTFLRSIPERLRLKGVIGGDTIVASLHRLSDESYAGYHPAWW